MREHKRVVRTAALTWVFCTLAMAVLWSAPVRAQDSWQVHMAQAHNFYRNRLYPKALVELRSVVADPEGAKQLKAWQLIIDIGTRMKELDTLIWALETGRALAEGQEAGQMQGQLYRLKRVYGRLVFEVPGGEGKLPKRGLELKVAEPFTDPTVQSHYEKARTAFEQLGYSVESLWLPAADYALDGAPLKVVAGRDTVVEVAPTAEVTFALEAVVLGGVRLGDASTGISSGLAGFDLGFGPHIKFASGSALVLHAGPLVMFGAQQTPDVKQDTYEAHQNATLAVGGTVMVAFEFPLGKVVLSPKVGYLAQYLPSGIYFRGRVISKTEGEGIPASAIEGDFVIPALAHGPRLGFQALLSPETDERGKRVPRVFVGLHGGPLWVEPQWGELAPGSTIPGLPTTVRRQEESSTADPLQQGVFTIESVIGWETAVEAKVFVDLQVLVGVQVRL